MRIFRIVFRFLFSPKKQTWKTYPQQGHGYFKPRAQASRPYETNRPTINPASIGTLQGKCYVIDGDTIVIGDIRIRLAGIDAPELDQPWGKSAKFAMIRLCKGKVITAHILEGESYDRIVARCFLPDGTDLSAALVEQGLALDWAKFSGGAYRHLEPVGIRRKLWRVTAKHQGRLAPPNS